MLLLVVGLLPAGRFKNRLLNLLGRHYRVAPNARIQPVLLAGVQRLVVGDGASVGVGNVFRDLREVSLGDHAEIGQFNWFTGMARVVAAEPAPEHGALRLGPESGVTSRHYVDCSGGVSVGTRAVVAGVRTTIFTHGIDLESGRVGLSPLVIGPDALVNAVCLLLPGAGVGERVVVAAGATVAGVLDQYEMIYAGVPAKPLRSASGTPYFERERGRLIPIEEHKRRLRADRLRRGA